MNHSFFQMIEWTAIDKRITNPPFVPKVMSEYDLRNFDEVISLWHLRSSLQRVCVIHQTLIYTISNILRRFRTKSKIISCDKILWHKNIYLFINDVFLVFNPLGYICECNRTNISIATRVDIMFWRCSG